MMMTWKKIGEQSQPTTRQSMTVIMMTDLIMLRLLHLLLHQLPLLLLFIMKKTRKIGLSRNSILPFFPPPPPHHLLLLMTEILQ